MAGPTVGVIGLGFGRAHIPAFQANGCDVVAVCQRDETGARKIADAHGVKGIFTRWEDLLERARPEIVVIATPPHNHLAIAEAAFARGAHVLCEKPVALTADEGQRILASAERSGRVAMTGFNWRFPAAMQTLHALVAEGAIGRPFHIGVRWLGSRWAAESAAATWRMDRTQAGHGVLGDNGVHVVDLVRWTFGEFKRVTATMGIPYPARSAPGVARPPDAEDWCLLLGELTNGAQVSVTSSRVAHGANETTLEAYGIGSGSSPPMGRKGGGGGTDNFGRQCLLARRFAEAGVRFIELSYPGWDQHQQLKAKLTSNAAGIDQPIAALINDLKQRGMLKDTLLVWGGEFGRTPHAQNEDGRDHNATGFSMWMAGGGVKGGQTYGATDEFGFKAVEKPVHVHDLHATMLRLMGFDHTRLTYRYAGRDFRLTDVHGKVVEEIIA